MKLNPPKFLVRNLDPDAIEREDAFIRGHVDSINKAVSDYLDECCAHFIDPEAKAQARAEIEIFFYKYYEIRLVRDETKPGYVFNAVVERRTDVALPGEEGYTPNQGKTEGSSE